MNKPSKDGAVVVVFQANDHWFYHFDYQWVRYCANQGYQSAQLAMAAGLEHLEQAI